MKILHICRNLAGSTVFPQLFETLSEFCDQTVFVPEVTEENRGKNEPNGIMTYYRRTLRKTDTLFFSRKAARTLPVLMETVNPLQFDLVHAHTLFTDGSIALALHQKTGIPFVVTLRYSDVAAIWRYEWHLHPLARRILRAASGVVCLSPVVREQVIGWMRSEERDGFSRKTVVIPNGIREAWLDGKPREAPHSPLRVGFAGVLNARKQPLQALLAVHKCRDGGTPAVFLGVGRGPLEGKLRAALKEGDAFLGRAEGMQAMKEFYGKVDLLLVPSRAETFGMVYLEAMSQGLPVIYTKGQGFDGQFPEGEVGFRVPCGDISAQADAISRIHKEYGRLSANACRHAEELSWKNVGEKWHRFYECALKGDGAWTD